MGNQFSEEMVCVNRSMNLNVDDLYFSKKMRENKENRTYKSIPVDVMALKVDWLLQDP